MSQAKPLASALRVRSDAYAAEAKALAEERDRHLADAARLEEQIERNRRELGGYLVPDLDDAALKAIERRFHYPSLMALKATFVEAIAAAERDRAALEADEDFINREILRIEAHETLAAVRPSYEEVKTLRVPWDTSSRHAVLLEKGFYDPKPTTGILRRLSFWRHGSLLMAQLEKKGVARFKDLDDLRQRWTAIMADFTPLDGAVSDARATLERMDALEARHQQLLAEPGLQFKRCFEAIGRAVVDHLLVLPEDTLVEFARNDPNLSTFLKKDAGLRKQVAYLREIAQVRLEPAIQSLNAEAKKASGKASRIRGKLARGRFVPASQQDLERARAIPHDKWAKRRSSFAKTRERIGDYHDYDRGSFVTTYLWWDTMTRGAPGHDLYEVRTFHERNPGWTASGFVDPAAAGLTAGETYRDDAAAAFADQLMSDDPAEGLFDAS